MAPQVLAAIDHNVDGRLQAAYVRSIQGDLDVVIDGTPQPLRLTSGTFPPAAAMRSGVGDIVLTFKIATPSPGQHRLVFQHRQSEPEPVYLVSILQPDNPAVKVLGQERSHDQSRYQLDFSMGGPPSVQAAHRPSRPFLPAMDGP